MQPKVVLIQLPVPALVPLELTANLPMAAANLILHARQDPELPADLRPVLFPSPVASRFGDKALLRTLGQWHPEIIGFTCTVWNIERTLYLARELKRSDPSLTIWLGGPEIAPDCWALSDAEAPFDLGVEGEGEQAFLSLLQTGGRQPRHPVLLPGGGRDGPSGPPSALVDLSTIHDPFIAGLVEPEADRAMLIELWRGCRFRCAFCRYHQSRPKEPAKRPFHQIEEVFGWARDHAIQEIYILDPSPDQRPDLPELLNLLQWCNRSPQIPIFAELRADRIDDDLAFRLYAAGITRVETGLQTTTQATLAKVARQLNLDRFTSGLAALARAGIQVKVDLMVGLPSDTEAGLLDSCRYLTDIGFSRHVQVFRTQVLPGTRLRRMAARWGLTYDPKPPYYVVSTPQWPEESISQAIFLAEEALDLSQAPEERPVLEVPRWSHHGLYRHRYPGSDAVLQVDVDLDRPEDFESWTREHFEDASVAMTLWIRAGDPTRAMDAIVSGVNRFFRANPFTSLCIAIDSEPEIPLDTFDRLDEVLDRDRPSNYLVQFHSGTAGTPRPERRLLSVLSEGQRRYTDESWLVALREVAEVVWLARCSDFEDALDRVEEDPPPASDYLLLDLCRVDEAGLAEHFARLLDTARAPEQILLSSAPLQWSWARFLARREETDW